MITRKSRDTEHSEIFPRLFRSSTVSLASFHTQEREQSVLVINKSKGSILWRYNNECKYIVCHTCLVTPCVILNRSRREADQWITPGAEVQNAPSTPSFNLNFLACCLNKHMEKLKTAIHKLSTHVCPPALSPFLTPQGVLLGTHSYWLVLNPVFLHSHRSDWPNFLKTSYITEKFLYFHQLHHYCEPYKVILKMEAVPSSKTSEHSSTTRCQLRKDH